jgi:hypothetical protein
LRRMPGGLCPRVWSCAIPSPALLCGQGQAHDLRLRIGEGL